MENLVKEIRVSIQDHFACRLPDLNCGFTCVCNQFDFVNITNFVHLYTRGTILTMVSGSSHDRHIVPTIVDIVY